MREIDKSRKGIIYTDLLLERSKAKTIVDKYDLSSDDPSKKKGYLTRDELLSLLKDQELKTGRDVKGIVITLVIGQNDVNEIMKKTDLADKKKIKPAHLIPILGAWEEMAEAKMKERENSSCCIIL